MRPEFLGGSGRLEHLGRSLLLGPQVAGSGRGLLVPGEEHDAAEIAAHLTKMREPRVAQIVVADPRGAVLIDARRLCCHPQQATIVV